jgi:hypothetical protein
MQKTLATALVAVTAVAALSACEVPETSTAGTGSKDHPVKSKPGMAAPDFTVAQENAIESAQSYLDMSGFSRAGLIHQLTSKAGEGYKMADAEFAVNHVKVNWNKEAAESAQSYLDMSSFSRAGLIQQLTSKAGDGFTPKQATYAVNKVGL